MLHEGHFIRKPLAGTLAEQFFTRQLDDYSCGAACLATLSKIYDIGIDYESFRQMSSVDDPDIGTLLTTMEKIAENFFPLENTDWHSYKGGVAIAHVVQGGSWHYVLVLCQEGDDVLYYDPYEHELVIDKAGSDFWMSDQRWTLNFAPLEDNSMKRWLDLADPKPPGSAPKPPKEAGPPHQPGM